ncbi:Cof-type HAD-IIB family hydrolase [Dyadobacter tibetensis]|uniref:Cof-type HAD-IIB family hydrolase n=1 Tax=Dyadobacter tibetensis TaxID=1211851 RepID=UPI000472C0D1|nr:Cof-type HAD-IIB family hydrolase [Dyadobacter tibetensis]
MNHNDIRLIATDMDGTLLNSQHQVSESFYPAFERLKELGIHFVAASGRQYFNLAKTLAPIKDDVIFVSENGSYVVFREEEIHVQALPHNDVYELIRMARAIKDNYIVICGKKKAYVESDAPEFLAHLTLYFERYEVVENLLEVTDDDFLKFTICDLKGSEQHVYPHFKHLHDQYQVKVSGPIWLDISHRQANKGVAMAMIQERLGVTKAQTMVFGDYFNDVEMLLQADHSYAMENAHPDVKKIARYTAESNDNNGVVKILQQVLLAQQAV